MQKNEQPTEMIVLPKGEYDLLRERVIVSDKNDDIDLIDLVIIPMKRWRLFIVIILIGFVLSAYLGVVKGASTELSLIVQSGTIFTFNSSAERPDSDLNSELILTKDQINRYFLSADLIEKMRKEIKASHYSIDYNDKKMQSILKFYTQDGADLDSHESLTLLIKELNEDSGIFKLVISGTLTTELLDLFAESFLALLIKDQQAMFEAYEQRISKLNEELRQITDSSLKANISGELIKRKHQLEERLYTYSQSSQEPTIVLKNSLAEEKISIIMFILPMITFVFLSIFCTYFLEFIEKSNFKDRLNLQKK